MPELPEELVEKAARAIDLSWHKAVSHPQTPRLLAEVMFDAIDLSSILRERDELEALLSECRKNALEHLSGGPVAATPPTGNDGQDSASLLHNPLTCEMCHTDGIVAEIAGWRHQLEAAEGERDAAFKNISDLTYKLADTRHQLAAMRGERDRLREALWAQKQAEENVWRLTDELSDLREAAQPFVALADEADKLRHESGSTCEWRISVDDLRALRAALSTGDRQEQHLGGTGAGVLPESHDGHDLAGGST